MGQYINQAVKNLNFFTQNTLKRPKLFYTCIQIDGYKNCRGQNFSVFTQKFTFFTLFVFITFKQFYFNFEIYMKYNPQKFFLGGFQGQLAGVITQYIYMYNMPPPLLQPAATHTEWVLFHCNIYLTNDFNRLTQQYRNRNHLFLHIICKSFKYFINSRLKNLSNITILYNFRQNVLFI